MPSPTSDQLRKVAETRLRRAEQRVEVAVLKVLRDWLETIRYQLIRDELDRRGMTAAGYNVDPGDRVREVLVNYERWRAGLTETIMPAIQIEFGEAFQSVRRDDALDPDSTGSFAPQQEWMQTVHDRLVIWPEGAFEKLRPRLVDALDSSDTIDDIRDQIGYLLGIDKDTRLIQTLIDDVDHALAEPDLDPADRHELRQRRRELWEAHDESLTRWQWKARRIARTETHGAVNAGQLAAAKLQEAELGIEFHKRWLATADTRTRPSHRLADGQSVKLSEAFTVGGFPLMFPGDPTGPGHEVINCRCTMLIYDPPQLQKELQGPDGSMGQLEPGGVRKDPDDPEESVQAVERLDAETEPGPRRDDTETTPAATPEPDTHSPDAGPPTEVAPNLAEPPDWDRYSDDDLLDYMLAKTEQNADDGLYEQALAEWDRRQEAPEPFTDDDMLDVDPYDDDDQLHDLPGVDTDVSEVHAWEPLPHDTIGTTTAEDIELSDDQIDAIDNGAELHLDAPLTITPGPATDRTTSVRIDVTAPAGTPAAVSDDGRHLLLNVSTLIVLSAVIDDETGQWQIRAQVPPTVQGPQPATEDGP